LDGTYVAGFDDAGKVEYKYPWSVAMILPVRAIPATGSDLGLALEG